MEVRRLSFHHRPAKSKVQSQEPGANIWGLDFGLGVGPEPSPAPSKIFVPEQHIYIDKPGF